MSTESDAKQAFTDAGGIEALAADLLDLSTEINSYDPDDLTGAGCDEPTIDCRLRYHDGSWSFLTGDSSYDQDHRGAWGCGCVGPNMTTDEARGLAIDLLDQVLDDLAQQEH